MLTRAFSTRNNNNIIKRNNCRIKRLDRCFDSHFPTVVTKSFPSRRSERREGLDRPPPASEEQAKAPAGVGRESLAAHSPMRILQERELWIRLRSRVNKAPMARAPGVLWREGARAATAGRVSLQEAGGDRVEPRGPRRLEGNSARP